MKRHAFAAIWLRLRIALAAANPVAFGALVLCIGAAAALAWLLPARELVEEGRVLARRQAALPAAATAAPVQAEPATDEYHLALFNAALGDRRHAERQVKTLFALAAREAGDDHRRELDAGGLCRIDDFAPCPGDRLAIAQPDLHEAQL